MFAAGATAEVASGDEDRSSLVAGVVEGVFGVLLAVVFEGVFAEAIEGDATEIPSGDDAVSIDVVEEERYGGAGDGLDFLHWRREGLLRKRGELNGMSEVKSHRMVTRWRR